VIETLRLEKPVLVGHSMAGQELSYLASEHQDRIAGLVYLDAAYRYAYDVPGELEKDVPSLPSPPPTLPAVARPRRWPSLPARTTRARRPLIPSSIASMKR